VFLLEATESATAKMTDLAFFSKLENSLRPQLEDVSEMISRQNARNLKARSEDFFSFAVLRVEPIDPKSCLSLFSVTSRSTATFTSIT